MIYCSLGINRPASSLKKGYKINKNEFNFPFKAKIVGEENGLRHIKSRNFLSLPFSTEATRADAAHEEVIAVLIGRNRVGCAVACLIANKRRWGGHRVRTFFCLLVNQHKIIGHGSRVACGFCASQKN